MRNFFLASICTAIVALISSTAKAAVQPGYWQITQVPVIDWIDWIDVVDSGIVVGSDTNPGNIGARGEWITSYFLGYSPGSYLLTSTSQGTIRLKFEWVGGGTPPSSITFDLYTEAIASVGGPTGSFALDEYYVVVDGHTPSIDSGSSGGYSYYTVQSSGTREVTVSTTGGLPVYYEVGFLNHMQAVCSYGATVACESSYSVTLH